MMLTIPLYCFVATKRSKQGINVLYLDDKK